MSPSKRYLASLRTTNRPTKATTPAATPAATARMRKYATIVSSERRPASHVRRTAETYAVTETASKPATIDVGLIQLFTGSPACPPAGTRPEAIPPATAPKQ